MRYGFQPAPRKVHLAHEQTGRKHKVANTLCAMNSNVPETHITTDLTKVTCKLCRQHRLFGVARPQLDVIAPAPEIAGGLRCRYRRSWTGKLILQVCETVEANRDLDGGGYQPKTLVEVWRDARLSDLVGGLAP